MFSDFMGGASAVPITEQKLEKISSGSAVELELRVGQNFYLELCGHVGKIIRTYDNGDIAVRCPQSHDKDPLRGDEYKGKFKYRSKNSLEFGHTAVTMPTSKRNLVYIIGTR
jgi:hypothetical protein